MIHEQKEDAGTDHTTGLWSIGAGITLGWDSETGGSVYFDEDWDYQGYTVRQEFYGGAAGARLYLGYEWGFDGMEGRGAYGGASALGANVEFAQNGGWSYGGRGEALSVSYDSKDGKIRGGVLNDMVSLEMEELAADGKYIASSDRRLNAFEQNIADNDPEMYTFVAHGSPDVIGRLGDKTGMSADAFADELKKGGYNYKNEGVIKLYSCQTGQKADGFAAQLAKRM